MNREPFKDNIELYDYAKRNGLHESILRCGSARMRAAPEKEQRWEF